MYIKRNDDGHIELVSREATPDCKEFMPANAPELLAFLMEGEGGEGAAHFQASDLAFVRVLEDVIELLMDKGVISFTDLPEAAQQKVMERQSLRRRLNGLNLVSGSDDESGGVI
ncbi:tryptophan synthase subunit beta like protein [Halomonas sp. M4R5S39]|uniref:Tryptophan synthase subunit beta like protein n=1 Tax=Halomonas kalidii TaxID=3043293 RepID=A0ABT6VQP4_9GAMM|nr:tryptophan synthase subunit beta like protein [Halomonas kalidii]MDI5936307.1 tryptophan synthase subunit beta like protein [Halomonas kalidii]MDI5984055.1 tryptophan synthase subunit beta like protein [Halomonas kalidii]